MGLQTDLTTPDRSLLTCPALLWARLTGRLVSLRDEPWLRGPMGEPPTIGDAYFAHLARKAHQELRVNAAGSGLMAHFDDLGGDDFDPARVHPRIREFYEHTIDHRLDLWSHWCHCVQPFGWLMTALFSRRLQQLNLPISPMAPCRGVTNDLVQLHDPETREVAMTGWLRRFNVTGDIIFLGLYSITQPRNAVGPCFKAVYPLPRGNATVLFRPIVHEDGSLELISAGRRFGDPGFYLLVQRDEETVWAKYIPAMQERLRLYVDNRDDVRADHVFRFWRLWFLKLHYSMPRLAPRAPLYGTVYAKATEPRP